MTRHLNPAVLRRYVDETDALLSYEKAHLLQCGRCRSVFESVRTNAETARGLMATEDPEPNLDAARAAILARTSQPDSHSFAEDGLVRRRTGAPRWFAAVAAALIVGLLFTYAPFRAYAQTFLTIFEPRELTPITITSADATQMRGLPDLRELGTLNVSNKGGVKQVPSLAAAAQAANQTILKPAYLPPSTPKRVEYGVTPPQTIRFTFDARKAAASAARKHEKLPPPPAGLNGSTLTVSINPAVIQSYGVSLANMHARKDHEHELPREGLIVAQSRVPSIHSTSASVETIESYLLSLPNVPDDVKAQIRAIRDPASTLPVPVNLDKNSAHPVTVHGAHGLLIGDNTGVGSVIMWVSDGTAHWVVGAYSADEITKVANSLTP
jgi:hypothetical protein